MSRNYVNLGNSHLLPCEICREGIAIEEVNIASVYINAYIPKYACADCAQRVNKLRDKELSAFKDNRDDSDPVVKKIQTEPSTSGCVLF